MSRHAGSFTGGVLVGAVYLAGSELFGDGRGAPSILRPIQLSDGTPITAYSSTGKRCRPRAAGPRVSTFRMTSSVDRKAADGL
jgi:hypothetical protein